MFALRMGVQNAEIPQIGHLLIERAEVFKMAEFRQIEHLPVERVMGVQNDKTFQIEHLLMR